MQKLIQSTHRDVIQRVGSGIVAAVLIGAAVLTPVSAAPAPAATPTKTPGYELDLTASKTTIDAGEDVTLHVRYSNVRSVTLDGKPIKDDRYSEQVKPCATTTYTLAAVLQSGGNVTRQVTIDVKGGKAGACLPDLAMGKIAFQFYPDPADASLKYVGVTFQYSNEGKAPAGPVSFRYIYSSPNMLMLLIPYYGNTEALAPGQRAQAALAPIQLQSGQTYSLTVTLDPKNTLTETTKTDNTGSAGFTVP
jgi:hypothetical protein